MISLDQTIAALDDATAKRVLKAFVQPRVRRGGEPPPAREVGAALREAFAPGDDEPPPGDGELARQALLLLADDPANRDAIRAMAANPAAQSFDGGVISGTILAGLVIAALQTHVKFERGKDGKWSVLVEKKPSKEGLITPLVKKLLAYVSGGKA